MNLLLFKLFAAPLLLLAVSVACHRWGETIGGLLMSLPLMSGPVSVFLALEHGTTFAAQATLGSLIAMVAQTGFCVVYYKLAVLGEIRALAGATAIFVILASLLQWSGLHQFPLFVLSILTVTVALSLLPKNATRADKIDLPWWDLPLRMVLVTFFVVGVTLIAPYVGPRASGLLGSFPVMTAILGFFAHRTVSPASAQQIMRGIIVGLLSCSTFFYVLSLTLTRLGLFTAYTSATLCLLAIQAILLLYQIRITRFAGQT